MELTHSYERAFPEHLRARYTWLEVRNAAAMISASDPEGLGDLEAVLGGFALTVPHLLHPGGGKSRLAAELDMSFRRRGWRETHMELAVHTSLTRQPWRTGGEDSARTTTSVVSGDTHKVDNVQRRIAVDVEWHAKDGNLDRDLSAFRALFDAGVIDAGVIITRSYAEIYHLANWLAHHLDRVNHDPRGKEVPRFGTTTTTTMEKLGPRLRRGDAGGCPVLAVGISHATYRPGARYATPDGTVSTAPPVPQLSPAEVHLLTAGAVAEDTAH